MPTVHFRIGVIRAKDLAIAADLPNALHHRDKTGFSDPYAVMRVNDKKYTTPVIYQTLNPEWNYTIDLKLNASRCPRFIHLTVWDKDTYGRDYLGEINIPIGNLFMRNGGEAMGGQARHYDDPQNQDVWFGLNKRSEKQNVSGEVCLRFGFVEDEVRSDEE
ncbi:C2 domain-containing protein [Jimgerdemannia flammicorona]|uniref:C2 domain-containing protein n=1 Tax=Jimgerdemannia flammicorona TaxID=994334 RepID=A0A433QZ76_9FUNG|nr:C2 domain-containing protein [Jimgerdemannia flammicorona]